MIETVARPTDGRGAAPPEEFIAELRAQGTRYHNLHPFHRRMDAGELNREELQRWVANRFYYQKCIPLKDAAILANCPEVEVRRVWVRRIIDHDGTTGRTGGIESWLRLGEALGVSREELLSERRVLPAVRYAVDAYVNFARQRPWIEAVASSLTELFGPAAMRVRLGALERHYPWIDPAGPAAKSGLVVGDVVTSVDGIDITGANAGLAFTLFRVPVGARVSLGLARGAAVTITTVAP